MALIARDLMVGNPATGGDGLWRGSAGPQCLASGFQGQRQWTDHLPNGDFLEAILNSSFDWNGIRAPYIVATENDALNGVSMLFGHLLTNTAQIFADVRTYWSPDSVKRVTGYELTGKAAGGILHLINSGPATLDGTGQQSRDGKPAMKPYWEITRGRGGRMPGCNDLASRRSGVFPRRRLVYAVHHAWRYACDHVPNQSGAGLGAGAADCRGLDGGVAGGCACRAG